VCARVYTCVCACLCTCVRAFASSFLSRARALADSPLGVASGSIRLALPPEGATGRTGMHTCVSFASGLTRSLRRGAWICGRAQGRWRAVCGGPLRAASAFFACRREGAHACGCTSTLPGRHSQFYTAGTPARAGAAPLHPCREHWHCHERRCSWRLVKCCLDWLSYTHALLQWHVRQCEPKDGPLISVSPQHRHTANTELHPHPPPIVPPPPRRPWPGPVAPHAQP